MVRKPCPPSVLPWHSFFHAIQCIPLWLPLEVHQNSATALVRFVFIDLDNLKHGITYVGKAEATNLMRTSFPLFQMNFEVQLFTLSWSLFLIKENIFVFTPPRLFGIPKYEPISPALEIPNNWFISCWTISSTLLPNCIGDFEKFICCPDTISYCVRMCSIVWHSALLAC